VSQHCAGNLFADIPAHLPAELIETLLTSESLRIERIVSQGHASPAGFWYDQDEAEWVLLLAGAARLEFEHQPPLELAIGDFVHIPAHQRHRVDWTDPMERTVWLAVYY
jgi:cupin 2 domain-containing protein